MRLKKHIKVPIFDADSDDWLGVLYMNRNMETHSYIEDSCEYNEDLDGFERELVEEFIDYPVHTGWWSINGGPCIYVVIGIIEDEDE